MSSCQADVSLSHPTKHNNIHTMTFSKPFRKTYSMSKDNRVHTENEREREREREIFCALQNFHQDYHIRRFRNNFSMTFEKQ